MAKKKRRTRRSQHPAGLKDPLLFIDTNILLDFYRARNEQGIALLNRIDDVRDETISCYQVEMEFKKNRQKVLTESLSDLRLPKSFTTPAYLADSQTVESAKKDLKSASKKLDRLKASVEKALKNPATNDPVYKVAQRLFCTISDFNLNRCNADLYKKRDTIRRLALKRFGLGYPPRKKNDTSIGDAVNWEWIIACAMPDKRDVVIVSRDSDYGIAIGDDLQINDWLAQEFRGRVSKQGQVVLTKRLSTALKLLDRPVSQVEKEGEETLLESVAHRTLYRRLEWERFLAAASSRRGEESDETAAYWEYLRRLTQMLREPPDKAEKVSG